MVRGLGVSWLLSCGAKRLALCFCAISMLVVLQSSPCVCQHGFVRGELLGVIYLSGWMQQWGLHADCQLRARAFSWFVLWKRTNSCWQGCLRQGVLPSRLSSLCWPARCHTTRLETRTKESIHMCEYVGFKLVCVMKVTVGT